MYNWQPTHVHLKIITHVRAGLPFEDMVRELSTRLAERYPRNINPRTDEWVFNNAGGAMGTMYVLHVSLTEYVIVWGTAVGTEGHTGRFYADDFFTLLRGEQWAHEHNSFERQVFTPGMTHHLPRFHAKQYRCPDECWSLEYARGPIPLMLPFGLADTFTSTLDPVPFVQTMYIMAREVILNLLAGKI